MQKFVHVGYCHHKYRSNVGFFCATYCTLALGSTESRHPQECDTGSLIRVKWWNSLSEGPIRLIRTREVLPKTYPSRRDTSPVLYLPIVGGVDCGYQDMGSGTVHWQQTNRMIVVCHHLPNQTVPNLFMDAVNIACFQAASNSIKIRISFPTEDSPSVGITHGQIFSPNHNYYPKLYSNCQWNGPTVMCAHSR